MQVVTVREDGRRRGSESVDHVYAHFPFCARTCPYCDFNSYAGRDAEMRAYVEALLVEARARLPGDGVRTLYVGGGTPTHAEPGVLAFYLDGLREAAGGVAEEFTVEANPGTLGRDRIRALEAAGVRRVSLGAQSFHEGSLAKLGRIHDVRATWRSVDALRAGGIPRVSLDLILAVPGQSLPEQARDIASAVALAPSHISAYVLTIEPGTVFHTQMRAGVLPPPDDDRELAHLRVAVAQLERAGYARYEVSNFARPGERSLHNLAYWRDADWVGLGAGAHSHQGARRWENLRDPTRYTEAVRATGEAVAWVERAPVAVRLFEALMMGLRLVDGVDLEAVGRRLGVDAEALVGERLEPYVRAGLLRYTRGRVRATTRGLEVLAYVLRDLVPEEEAEREAVRVTPA